MKVNPHLDINPKTKIGELLETYPELEEVLIGLAPDFKKLKNPMLRKTIGKIATLQQVASMGGIPVGDIIRVLRSETGLDTSENFRDEAIVILEEPDWFSEVKIGDVFNASPMIERGEHPMPEIMSKLDESGDNEIFQIITPFVPSPIIEMISKKGYSHYCRKIDEKEYHTFFKNP